VRWLIWEKKIWFESVLIWFITTWLICNCMIWFAIWANHRLNRYELQYVHWIIHDTRCITWFKCTALDGMLTKTVYTVYTIWMCCVFAWQDWSCFIPVTYLPSNFNLKLKCDLWFYLWFGITIWFVICPSLPSSTVVHNNNACRSAGAEFYPRWSCFPRLCHRVHGTAYHHLFELFPPSFRSDTSWRHFYSSIVSTDIH